MNKQSTQQAQSDMVEYQLKQRGISDSRILQAFYDVPRHKFTNTDDPSRAYGDFPLPIGENQTISQPYIVALMTELLTPRDQDKVLEIGTGSGYQTAILAQLVDTVYTVERKQSLIERAQQTLEELGFENIVFKTGDGTGGWQKHSPYDKIIGTGAVPSIPDVFVEQLHGPGKLVIPTGPKGNQYLHSLTKEGGSISEKQHTPCAFVPLVGEKGW